MQATKRLRVVVSGDYPVDVIERTLVWWLEHAEKHGRTLEYRECPRIQVVDVSKPGWVDLLK